MYKICLFVPEDSVESVKSALFNAGAGCIGNYDQCCWQTAGTGQFRPLENSQPTIGTLNKIESVPEIKLELVCEDALIEQAIYAMKQSHPYEEPAYHVWRLENF